jgi:hypothetical protein
MVAETGDGVVLRLWLETLGWQVRSRCVDETLVGVASHTDGNGREFHVVGRGQNEGELVLQLFEAAMNAAAIMEFPLDQQLAAA